MYHKLLILLSFLWSILFVASCSEEDDGHSHGDVGEVLNFLPTADAVKGDMFFANTCGVSTCHGADGTNGPAPKLSEMIPAHTDMALASVIRNGAGRMPAQSAELEDSEIADVIKFVRNKWPNR